MGKIQSPFLPKLTTVDNMPLLLPDAIDNLVVNLGREAISLGLVLKNLENLPNTVEAVIRNKKSEKAPVLTPENKKRYFETVAIDYAEMRIWTQQHISEANSLAHESDGLEKEKLLYYAGLTEAYLHKMDYIASLINEGIPYEITGAIAGVVNHVGRKNIDQLVNILSTLNGINSRIQNGEIKGDDVDDELFASFSPIYHFTKDSKPSWFINLANWYAGWIHERR